MTLRSARERALQTISFELGAIAVVAPAYAGLIGGEMSQSLTLFFAISLTMLAWGPAFNTAFDWIDRRLTGRVASDRPPGLRLVHAVLDEVTSTAVSLPVILALTDLGFWAALTLDVALTLYYVVYTYIFHVIYDRLRPIPSDGAGLSARLAESRHQA